MAACSVIDPYAIAARKANVLALVCQKMSAKRQMPIEPNIPDEIRDVPEQDHPRRVVALAADLPRGYVNGWHSHERGQLLYTRSGAVTVWTDDGVFVLPPDRAVWIAPNSRHATRYLIRSELRTIYVRTETVAGLPNQTTAVNVTPLLRELLLTFMTFARDYSEDGAEGRLVRVMLDQIIAAPSVALRLPVPEDEKLKPLAESVRNHPEFNRPTVEIARDLAMSLRTFERRFARQTGMTFRAWRNKAKMLKALELLSTGATVGDTADQLGYEGQSAFIANFKTTFGKTPGRYFSTPGP